jgi:hypothetical protein
MPERKHAKRHATAWDAALTDDQRDQVFAKATTGGFTWAQIAAFVAESFGIPQPGRTALYRFLDYWRAHYLARRVQERILARDALRAEREQVGDLSAETLQALEDQAAAAIALGDTTAGARLFQIAASIRDDVRKREELALRRETLALSRAKFDAAERRAALADQAEQVCKSTLTPDEKDRRYREIFGLV